MTYTNVDTLKQNLVEISDFNNASNETLKMASMNVHITICQTCCIVRLHQAHFLVTVGSDQATSVQHKSTFTFVGMVEFDKRNYFRGIGGFKGFPVFGNHEPGNSQNMHGNFTKRTRYVVDCEAQDSQSWIEDGHHTRHICDYCEDLVPEACNIFAGPKDMEKVASLATS